MDAQATTLRLKVERVGGQWLVTSPDLPELHVAHADQETALASVPGAMEALKRVAGRFGPRRARDERAVAGAA